MVDEPVQGSSPTAAESAPAGPTQGLPEPAAASRGGIDLQLVGLAVVLWLVAVAIVVSKWNRVRVDWRLGDIKERLDLDGGIDEGALEGLVALGRDDPEGVVPLLGDELYGPQRNRDERYRIVLVKALERIPGLTGQQALLRAVNDVDPRVRANVYVSLEARAKAQPEDRQAAVELLELAMAREPEPVARAYAVRAMDGLGGLEKPHLETCWPFVVAFREARSADDPMSLMVRTEAAKALRLLAKSCTLALEAGADEPAREAQVRAWEEWYRSQGGEVPEGQEFEAWKAQLEASTSPVGTAAPAGQGEGAR